MRVHPPDMSFDPAVTDEIDAIADRIWSRIVGANFDPLEFNLRAKLAIETRLLGSERPPFGLDRLSAAETGSYIGVQAATLHDRHKRKALGIPDPYNIGRKLFWRRSELDPWIEQQREARPALDVEGVAARPRKHRT
jgi:predicted DNA-binding transcriptional regulator AlpA